MKAPALAAGRRPCGAIPHKRAPPRPPIHPFSGLLIALAVLAAPGPSRAHAPAAPRQPQAMAGDYRIVVDVIDQYQSAALGLAEPLPATEANAPQHRLSLQISIVAPSP